MSLETECYDKRDYIGERNLESELLEQFRLI